MTNLYLLFFATYPVVLMSLLPVTLLAYDERSQWNRFCAALPIRPSQVVSAKYLISLLLTLPTIGLVLLCCRSASLVLLLIPIGTLTSALCLPCLFRWGVEKGRLLYYIIIGLSCAAGFLVKDLPTVTNPAILLLCAAAQLLSWRVSVRVYEKAEVK